MYKHILVATDGSELSETAIEQAVALADALKSKLTVLTVIRPWHAIAPAEVMVAFPEEEYRKGVEAAARKYLSVAVDAAQAKGIACEPQWVVQERPWEAIIATAEEKGCDLIVMGSHGRSGLTALFVGSETQKVLAHGKFPVLVCR